MDIEISYRPIGIIRTPFREAKDTPIQPAAAGGAEGTVEVSPEYAGGLEDLEGFSHVMLIYHFHKAEKSGLKVRPFMDSEERGVFATRAPSRPNRIGISVVRLLGVKGNVLSIGDADMLDGTPLLDIKPFVPEFDAPAADRIGWLEEQIHRLNETKDDGRFERRREHESGDSER